MTTDDYKVSLEVFEGPLDLLLYLIRREELDIYDIPIERITTQYVECLDVMRMLDLTVAGEFLVMAATLMMIKSRMLLPVEERAAEEESEDDWVDPRLDLVRQLVEYKKFKDAAARLLERETLQGEVFGSGGEGPLWRAAEEEARPLGDVGLFDLLTAFQSVLAHTPVEPFGHLEPIRWTVSDKMEEILGLARSRGAVAFSRLFHAGSPRGEIIVTFLALLELLRLRQVAARQDAAFCEITILPVADDVPGTSWPAPVIGGGEHVPA